MTQRIVIIMPIAIPKIADAIMRMRSQRIMKKRQPDIANYTIMGANNEYVVGGFIFITGKRGKRNE